MKKTICFVLFCILFLPYVTNAEKIFTQAMSAGDLDGIDISFDPKDKYFSLDLTHLWTPPEEEPSWWKKVFFNRGRYGIGYITIEIQKENINFRQLLFAYDLDNENKKYESITATRNLPYPLLQKITFPVDSNIEITIVVKNWAGKENIGIAKKIVAKLNEVPVISDSPYLATASTVIGFVEAIWPPDPKKDDILHIAIQEKSITKKYLPISLEIDHEKHKFLELQFDPEGSIIARRKSLSAAVESGKFGDVSFWRKSIQQADRELKNSDSIAPLEMLLSSFCEYVEGLKLTNRDKILYVGGAIYEWAQNAVIHNPPKSRFKAVHYRRLPLSNLEKFRKLVDEAGLPWEFEGGACLLPACYAASDFVSKSGRPTSKKSTKKYIDGEFNLIIQGKENIDDFVNEELYLKNFRIRGDSDLKYLSRNKYLFYSLSIKYNNKWYKNRPVIIKLYEDGDGNFYIDRIEVKTKDVAHATSANE